MREDPDEAGSLEPLNSNESSVQGRSPHAYLAQSSSHRHLRDGLWGNQNGTKLTELTEIQMFFLNKCPLYLPLWFISRVLKILIVLQYTCSVHECINVSKCISKKMSYFLTSLNIANLYPIV